MVVTINIPVKHGTAHLTGAAYTLMVGTKRVKFVLAGANLTHRASGYKVADLGARMLNEAYRYASGGRKASDRDIAQSELDKIVLHKGADYVLKLFGTVPVIN